MTRVKASQKQYCAAQRSTGTDANRRSLTTSVDNRPNTSITGAYIYCIGDRSQFNQCNGSPFVKTQRICHRSHTYPARYLNKSSTINYNCNCFLRSQHPIPLVKLSELNVSRSQATQADKHHGSDVQSILASLTLRSLNFGGGHVGCQNVTAKNQSLQEERCSTGAQHSNLLFKYLVGTSTQVSEHEP